MTPEERAQQAIDGWGIDGWGGRLGSIYPNLKIAIADAIRAAVAEAVAGEREACASIAIDLGFIHDSSKGSYDLGLEIAASIRDRSRGEGEG